MRQFMHAQSFRSCYISIRDLIKYVNLLHDYEKFYRQNVRKLKPWTPAEKRSIFLYSSARFYHFQPQFDTELKKKNY